MWTPILDVQEVRGATKSEKLLWLEKCVMGSMDSHCEHPFGRDFRPYIQRGFKFGHISY